MRGMDSRTNHAFFMSLIEIDERYMKTEHSHCLMQKANEAETNLPMPDLPPAFYSESIQNGTGVSSNYVQKENHQWFVLRATYGRSEQAYEFITKKHIEAYIPKHHVLKETDGKKKRILEPLLPNLLFVYATETMILTCMKKLSYLRFYRDKTQAPRLQDGKNPPLIINYQEMMNFIRLTSIDDEHIKIVDAQHCHYKSGDLVRITNGKFKGIVGRVARVGGQQTVVVEIEGLCLVATAYVPSAFLEREECY